MNVCGWCGHRIRDAQGRYTLGDVCAYCDDLPALQPLTTEERWIRMTRTNTQTPQVTSNT